MKETEHEINLRSESHWNSFSILIISVLGNKIIIEEVFTCQFMCPVHRTLNLKHSTMELDFNE